MFDISLLSVWISDETLPLVFDISLLSVWISDETLHLVFDILLLSVWTSNETLLLVFDISLLSVSISDETLRLVSDILLLSVWISDETLLLVFDILLLCFWISNEAVLFVSDISLCRCLDIEWNASSHVWYIIFHRTLYSEYMYLFWVLIGSWIGLLPLVRWWKTLNGWLRGRLGFKVLWISYPRCSLHISLNRFTLKIFNSCRIGTCIMWIISDLSSVLHLAMRWVTHK